MALQELKADLLKLGSSGVNGLVQSVPGQHILLQASTDGADGDSGKIRLARSGASALLRLHSSSDSDFFETQVTKLSIGSVNSRASSGNNTGLLNVSAAIDGTLLMKLMGNDDVNEVFSIIASANGPTIDLKHGGVSIWSIDNSAAWIISGSVALNNNLSMGGTANILWASDGVGSLGSAGANRPNNAHIKNSILVDGSGAGGIGVGASVDSTNLVNFRRDVAGITRGILRNTHADATAVARWTVAGDAGDLNFSAGSVAGGAFASISADATFIGGLSINQLGTNPFTIRTNSTDRFKIQSDGHVDLYSPHTVPLRVKSNLSNADGLRLYANTSTDVASIINYYAAALELGTSNLVRVTIAANGDVDIAQNLVVQGSLTVNGSTNVFKDGGNSFGQTANLGTNDAFDLDLKTNGVSRMTISSTGVLTAGLSYMGWSATPSASIKMRIGVGGSDNDFAGIKLESTQIVTANGTRYFIGFDAGAPDIRISTGITNSGYFIGSRSYGLRDKAADLGALHQLSGIDIAAGHYVTAGATISTTEVYGINIKPYQEVGTITSFYGVRIAAPNTGGTVTNNWAFYQDATAMRNYFAGQTLIGNPSVPTGSGAPTARLHVRSDSGTPAILAIGDGSQGNIAAIAYGTSNAFNGYRAQGTAAAPTAVGAQSLTNLQGFGYDGSAFALGGYISIQSGSTWTGSNHETYFLFGGTPNGSTTAGTLLEIRSNGQVRGLDGTAALPTYTFINGGGASGLYSQGSGSFAASIAGVAAQEWGTGGIDIRGSAALPLIVKAAVTDSTGLKIYIATGLARIVNESGGDVLQLGTNNTDRFQIDAAGSVRMLNTTGADFLWNTDGGGNIGALGANRPDNIYVKTSATVGGTISTSNTAADYHAIRMNAGTLTGTARLLWRNSDASRHFEIDGTFTSGDESLLIQSESVTIAKITRSGKLQMVHDGTEGLPAYSFTGSTGMGWWRAGPNDLRPSISGVGRFSINTTGLQFLNSSNLTWDVDGSGNIGAPGANRPDNIYVKTAVVIGSFTLTGSELSYIDDAEGLTTVVLTDNTASPSDVATWAHASYSAVVVHYSLSRGAGIRETGTVLISTDGTTATLARDGAAVGTNGISFSADVSGASVRWRFTSTATGTNATLKYKVLKWLA